MGGADGGTPGRIVRLGPGEQRHWGGSHLLSMLQRCGSCRAVAVLLRRWCTGSPCIKWPTPSNSSCQSRSLGQPGWPTAWPYLPLSGHRPPLNCQPWPFSPCPLTCLAFFLVALFPKFAGPNFPVVGEYPANPPPGFNPHGIAIDAARQKLVTAEYLDYR